MLARCVGPSGRSRKFGARRRSSLSISVRSLFRFSDVHPVVRESDLFSEFGQQLRRLSVERFGNTKRLEMVGTDPATVDLQRRITKIASFGEPVLITGESGAGKESVARALYLLGPRVKAPFMAVNCPQYQDGNLTVSELFGHERGSFTGAVSERQGCFEGAQGGVVFLDEVGDLPMSAQVMLLRALAEGEFKRIGSNISRRFDVRVVAATNRPLEGLMEREQFRGDLYFRLRYFELRVPPLRERGDDWALLIQHRLMRLAEQYGVVKRMSRASWDVLADYHWPGNARELANVVAMGYAMADRDLIEPRDFEELLGRTPRTDSSGDPVIDALFRAVVGGRGNFFSIVGEPFLKRDLNRHQVRAIVQRGLAMADQSYRRLVPMFRLEPSCYQKFMDFLRHHDLKPPARGRQ